MIATGNRDWADARAKVDAEGHCRACGRPDSHEHPLEADHVSGRKYDDYATCKTCQGTGRKLANSGACGRCVGTGKSKTVKYVDPLDIVPLCGPEWDPTSCHGKKHRRELDLLPILNAEEQARVVLHLGSIMAAFMHLAGESAPSKVVGR